MSIPTPTTTATKLRNNTAAPAAEPSSIPRSTMPTTTTTSRIPGAPRLTVNIPSDTDSKDSLSTSMVDEVVEKVYQKTKKEALASAAARRAATSANASSAGVRKVGTSNNSGITTSSSGVVTVKRKVVGGGASNSINNTTTTTSGVKRTTSTNANANGSGSGSTSSDPKRVSTQRRPVKALPQTPTGVPTKSDNDDTSVPVASVSRRVSVAKTPAAATTTSSGTLRKSSISGNSNSNVNNTSAATTTTTAPSPSPITGSASKVRLAGAGGLRKPTVTVKTTTATANSKSTTPTTTTTRTGFLSRTNKGKETATIDSPSSSSKSTTTGIPISGYRKQQANANSSTANPSAIKKSTTSSPPTTTKTKITNAVTNVVAKTTAFFGALFPNAANLKRQKSITVGSNAANAIHTFNATNPTSLQQNEIGTQTPSSTSTSSATSKVGNTNTTKKATAATNPVLSRVVGITRRDSGPGIGNVVGNTGNTTSSNTGLKRRDSNVTVSSTASTVKRGAANVKAAAAAVVAVSRGGGANGGNGGGGDALIQRTAMGVLLKPVKKVVGLQKVGSVNSTVGGSNGSGSGNAVVVSPPGKVGTVSRIPSVVGKVGTSKDKDVGGVSKTTATTTATGIGSGKTGELSGNKGRPAGMRLFGTVKRAVVVAGKKSKEELEEVVVGANSSNETVGEPKPLETDGKELQQAHQRTPSPPATDILAEKNWKSNDGDLGKQQQQQQGKQSMPRTMTESSLNTLAQSMNQTEDSISVLELDASIAALYAAQGDVSASNNNNKNYNNRGGGVYGELGVKQLMDMYEGNQQHGSGGHGNGNEVTATTVKNDSGRSTPTLQTTSPVLSIHGNSNTNLGVPVTNQLRGVASSSSLRQQAQSQQQRQYISPQNSITNLKNAASLLPTPSTSPSSSPSPVPSINTIDPFSRPFATYSRSDSYGFITPVSSSSKLLRLFDASRLSVEAKRVSKWREMAVEELGVRELLVKADLVNFSERRRKLGEGGDGGDGDERDGLGDLLSGGSGGGVIPVVGSGIPSRVGIDPMFSFSTTEKFSSRLLKGVPHVWRGHVWYYLLTHHSGLFDVLTPERRYRLDADLIRELQRYQTVEPLYADEIARDCAEALPNHVMFLNETSPGRKSLKRILTAFSQRDPDLGYVSAMAKIAALLLLVMEEERAYIAMVHLYHISNNPKPQKAALYGMKALHYPGLPALPEMLYIHDELMKRWTPKLRAHFADISVNSILYATDWYLSLFVSCTPFLTMDEIDRLNTKFQHQGPPSLSRGGGGSKLGGQSVGDDNVPPELLAYDCLMPFRVLVRVWDMLLLWGLDSVCVIGLALLKKHEETMSFLIPSTATSIAPPPHSAETPRPASFPPWLPEADEPFFKLLNTLWTQGGGGPVTPITPPTITSLTAGNGAGSTAIAPSGKTAGSGFRFRGVNGGVDGSMNFDLKTGKGFVGALRYAYLKEGKGWLGAATAPPGK
ncbi:hypothetical protein HDU76_000844 [Blyttiomyces sp. JEL0837]|nr:hypothetical protein HDU76_000844 [Blyttiomyces sp. JEL0837]